MKITGAKTRVLSAPEENPLIVGKDPGGIREYVSLELSTDEGIKGLGISFFGWKLTPALKTAVAYPLNSRLRTGLTLAMLALVIFTLIVMSMLNTSFGTALDDIDSVTGGWDIGGNVSYNNPIEDKESELPVALGADSDQIAAVGRYTSMPAEVRQVGAEEQQWRSYQARGANPSYLENTGHDFKIIAEGYGTTKEEVWKAAAQHSGSRASTSRMRRWSRLR